MSYIKLGTDIKRAYELYTKNFNNYSNFVALASQTDQSSGTALKAV